MPGVYDLEDCELVGFIVGVVEKGSIINGKNIKVGDAILGLPSKGLHTNGYSLVRRIFSIERSELDIVYPELGRTLGEELLETHRCYYNVLKPILHLIKGMAHITGGGIIDNVPRILPDNTAARFHSRSWDTLPIFSLIQELGNVDSYEMFHVFNMGLGMTVVCTRSAVDKIIKEVPEAMLVGEVIEQQGEDRVVII
jgi:phosphoribosylformylglycinamidine cyclo-ligase